MINIIKDVDLINEVDKYDGILLGTHTYCSLRNGIQGDIALNYGYVREANLNTRYGDINKMGTILECTKEDEPLIILMYILKGYPKIKKKGEVVDSLSYESLEKCLALVNILHKGKHFATSMIGCSRFDGNGDKEKVMEIINRTVTDFDLTIYDFYQKKRDEKLIERYKEQQEIKKVDRNLYYKIVAQCMKEGEERFKKNGFARY